MAKRQRRRARPVVETRASDRAPRRNGLRAIVLIAVIGLILLSMASMGGVAGPTPTATPLL